MKCFLLMSYDVEVESWMIPEYAPSMCYTIKNCNSKKAALNYLQKNILDEESGKPHNHKTLLEYEKKYYIFCFLEKDKKEIIKYYNIDKENIT